MSERCDTCGRDLAVGDWPYCPHGRGMFFAEQDEIPGGQVFENGFDTPQVFYSHSEHRRALKERGCQIAAKWAGPLDRHLINWAAGMDAQTLENARVLVSRGVRVDAPEPFQKDADITITRASLEGRR